MACQNAKLYMFFTLVIFVNIAFWQYSRDIQTKWLNVPPAPSVQYSTLGALGDKQFFMRSSGLALQNMGDMGGRNTPLKDYNYDTLGQWLFLSKKLDGISNYFPFLAAYYFGATQDKKQLSVIIDYLADVGGQAGNDKWRWLAQAVYLARFHQNDLDKALNLAYALASISTEDMPAWTRQMPALVLNAKGEKEAAYSIIVEVLRSKGTSMDPAEVNAMKAYVCEQILDENESVMNPICENVM